MAKTDSTIASVDRAIDIIEFIYASGGECTLTAIAQGLGLYKSAVHRVLQTLKARNFIYQDEHSGRYGLGTRFFVLGKMVDENMAILKTIRPYADRLLAKYNECVHITVPYNTAGDLPRQLLIGKFKNPNSVLTVSPAVGTISYCHCSASGKVMLAFGPADVLEPYRFRPLLGFTENTITDWGVLEGQLSSIRVQGWATEDGESELGLSCTAVPVLNYRGELCVVLSISGPTSRLRACNQEEIIHDLKQAAADMQSGIS